MASDSGALQLTQPSTYNECLDVQLATSNCADGPDGYACGGFRFNVPQIFESLAPDKADKGTPLAHHEQPNRPLKVRTTK